MAEPQPAAAPAEGATPVAQPTAVAPAPAGQPVEPAQQAQPQAPSVDDTAEWLSKKGLDPSDPEFATKLAKSYREAEKLALRATQEASELKRTLTPPPNLMPQDGTQGDPVIQEFVQDYRRDKLINGFKESHPDWHEHEPAMVQMLNQQTPSGHTVTQLVNAGVMSLEMVYAAAKGLAPSNTEQIKTQAQQEVLQTLANTQRAGGGAQHATDTNPSAPKDDPILAAIRASRG